MLPPVTCVTDVWNVYVPSDVLSCTARCSVPARKLTSSGRKRFEKETYSTARQHSTKPDVTSCNDLTGHWGRTNQRETHRYDEMLNRTAKYMNVSAAAWGRKQRCNFIRLFWSGNFEGITENVWGAQMKSFFLSSENAQEKKQDD